MGRVLISGDGIAEKGKGLACFWMAFGDCRRPGPNKMVLLNVISLKFV